MAATITFAAAHQQIFPFESEGRKDSPSAEVFDVASEVIDGSLAIGASPTLHTFETLAYLLLVL